MHQNLCRRRRTATTPAAAAAAAVAAAAAAAVAAAAIALANQLAASQLMVAQRNIRVVGSPREPACKRLHLSVKVLPF